jgi:hypothetical protein
LSIVEVCHLFSQYVDDEKTENVIWCWWEAQLATLQGALVIEQSPKRQQSRKPQDRDFKAELQAQRNDYAQLLAILLADGWEPVGTDETGLVRALKRAR